MFANIFSGSVLVCVSLSFHDMLECEVVAHEEVSSASCEPVALSAYEQCEGAAVVLCLHIIFFVNSSSVLQC